MLLLVLMRCQGPCSAPPPPGILPLLSPLSCLACVWIGGRGGHKVHTAYTRVVIKQARKRGRIKTRAEGDHGGSLVLVTGIILSCDNAIAIHVFVLKQNMWAYIWATYGLRAESGGTKTPPVANDKTARKTESGKKAWEHTSHKGQLPLQSTTGKSYALPQTHVYGQHYCQVS